MVIMALPYTIVLTITGLIATYFMPEIQEWMHGFLGISFGH